MKTLDEVIFEAPYSPTPWEADALHYLKEYKTLQTAYITAMADLEDNPPLTWDELKEMEGQPVWVEGEHGCIYDMKSWALVSFDRQGYMKCQLYDSSEFWIGEEDYGTDWQAYRKERE